MYGYKLYRCKNCKQRFSTPKTSKEIIGTDNQYASIEYDYCPYCDSSSIEILKCSICGKEIKGYFDCFISGDEFYCEKCAMERDDFNGRS